MTHVVLGRLEFKSDVSRRCFWLSIMLDGGEEKRTLGVHFKYFL